MNIFKRVSDILSANLHELIDRWEDPERMLKQAVREMETAFDETLHAAAKAIADERLLGRQQQQVQHEAQRAHQRAAAAVKRGDDRAARAVLRIKAEQQRLSETIGETREAAANQADGLRRQVESLRQRLLEARQMMHLLVARHRMAKTRRQLMRAPTAAGVVQARPDRFGRMREAIEREEAEADAFVELSGESTWDSVAADTVDIELELEVLKAECATNEDE